MATPKKLPKEFQAQCALCTWRGKLKANDLADGEIVTCPECGGHVTIVTDWPPPEGAVIAAEPKADEKVYFTPAMWKGAKQVFKCATCGTFLEERDDMVEHVLIHVPQAEQEKVFDQLVKEK